MQELEQQIDLKPCPFCYGTADLWNHGDVFIHKGKAHPSNWVECRVCSAGSSCYATPELAALAWNARANEVGYISQEVVDRADYLLDLRMINEAMIEGGGVPIASLSPKEPKQ